jgi:hypothetical protein
MAAIGLSVSPAPSPGIFEMPTAGIELDKPHAFLQRPSRDETLSAKAGRLHIVKAFTRE